MSIATSASDEALMLDPRGFVASANSNKVARADDRAAGDTARLYPRNRNLCNFPVSVRGSASRNSTARGYL